MDHKHHHFFFLQWATVCFKLHYYTLKTVCSSLVAELKRLHQNNLGLSVASTISDRLLYLLANNHDAGHSAVDRSLMYSEATRRETFAKWPHMNYKSVLYPGLTIYVLLVKCRFFKFSHIFYHLTLWLVAIFLNLTYLLSF
jgi:hypothetical protein